MPRSNRSRSSKHTQLGNTLGLLNELNKYYAINDLVLEKQRDWLFDAWNVNTPLSSYNYKQLIMHLLLIANKCLVTIIKPEVHQSYS